MRCLPLLPLLTLIACGPDETISGYADSDATYVLQSINDAPVTARATIRFPAPGEITGDGPCNSYSASQTAPYPWFDAGPIAATRRACPDLPAEAAFFDALGGMTIAEVSTPVLILSNDTDDILVFQAE